MNSTIKKNSYIWNSVSGMINAGQSAIILVFIAYNYSTYEAGLFSIAYALGTLVFSLGRYGVRNFQITDVREKYRFAEYFWGRILSVGLTVGFVLLYLLIQSGLGNYDAKKCIIVFLICIWKLIDAWEDVFWGMYQQNGRLDIGAKYYSIRLMISTVQLCVLLMLHMDFALAIAITVATSVLVSAVFLFLTFPQFHRTLSDGRRDYVAKLMAECLPLCLGTTLEIYVGNMPKYMIDWYSNEENQALFGYIMMPAFGIMVLNNFIYQPIVRDFGEMYYHKKIKEFLQKILRQCGIVAALTFVVMGVCAVIGIPVLDLLFNVDLAGLKAEFMLLIVGGGLYALVSFLMIPLTTMRCQREIAVSFVIVAIAGLYIGRLLVWKYAIMGASLLYIIINAALAVLLMMILISHTKKEEKV